MKCHFLIFDKPERGNYNFSVQKFKNQLTEYSPKGVLLAFDGLYFQPEQEKLKMKRLYPKEWGNSKLKNVINILVLVFHNCDLSLNITLLFEDTTIQRDVRHKGHMQ